MSLRLAVMFSLCVACHPAPRPARAARDEAAPPAPDAAVAPSAPDASAPDDVVAASAPERDDRELAYTDDAVVARLVDDPRYTLGDGTANEHGCQSDIDPQSCVPNPCHEGMGRTCRHGCRDACVGCERGCRETLSRCLADAREGDARRGCGRDAGACLEACLGHKDQCLTGVCAPRQEVCEREQERSFHEGPCHVACARCAPRCDGTDHVGACYAACFRRNPGCDAGQRSICIMAGPDYGGPQPAP